MKFFSRRNLFLLVPVTVVLMFLLADMALAREYTYELRASISQEMSSGRVDSGGEKTDLGESRVAVETSFGYIVNDNVEPFIDVTYKTSEDKVGDSKTSDDLLDWGVGMLFNIPVFDEEAKKTIAKDKPKTSTPKMSYSTWIPYGGVVLASQARKRSGGESAGAAISQDAIVTKLIFGTRYMLFPNIGLDFSLRAFYQDTQSKAETGTSQSGGTKKLTVQTNLLSMTLMF